MTPPRVYLVNEQLYLEEGAELTNLLPLDDVVRRRTADRWTMFILGVLFGAICGVLRFVLQ